MVFSGVIPWMLENLYLVCALVNLMLIPLLQLVLQAFSPVLIYSVREQLATLLVLVNLMSLVLLALGRAYLARVSALLVSLITELVFVTPMNLERQLEQLALEPSEFLAVEHYWVLACLVLVLVSLVLELMLVLVPV